MPFEINAQDWAKLADWFHRAPKKFQRASAMYLNHNAFGARKEAIKYMRATMTIRSPRFLDYLIRVEKAKSTDRLDHQISYFGSIQTRNHTGWAEQQGEAQDKRTKTITLAARRKSKSRPVVGTHRMKKGNSFETPDDYPGRTARQRANIMLQHLRRSGYRKPFIIRGHRKYRAGLYKIEGTGENSRVLPIQQFKKSPRKTMHKPWKTIAVRRYFNRLNSGALWSDIVSPIVMPKGGGRF